MSYRIVGPGRGAASVVVEFDSWVLPAGEPAFSLRRSILRAAFFCCFSFRAHAFCRFLNVSIIPSLITSVEEAKRRSPQEAASSEPGGDLHRACADWTLGAPIITPIITIADYARKDTIARRPMLVLQ